MASIDPMNLDYRVRRLEEWQKMVENEGVAKTLAVMDERQKTIARNVEAKSLADAAQDVRVNQRLDALEKAQNERSGFINGTKGWVVVGLGTLLLAGGFALQLFAALGAQ